MKDFLVCLGNVTVVAFPALDCLYAVGTFFEINIVDFLIVVMQLDIAVKVLMCVY